MLVWLGSSLREQNKGITPDSVFSKDPPILSPYQIPLPISENSSHSNLKTNGSSTAQSNGHNRSPKYVNSNRVFGWADIDSVTSSTASLHRGLPVPQSTNCQESLHQPHRSIPHSLASEISQFASTDFARTYFAIHRRGIIWRRKIPVEEMMTWSKVKKKFRSTWQFRSHLHMSGPFFDRLLSRLPF
jgi:hypothetical protein